MEGDRLLKIKNILLYNYLARTICIPRKCICLLNVERDLLLDDLPLGIFALESGFAQFLHDITLFALRVLEELACLVQLLRERIFFLECMHPLLQVHLQPFVALRQQFVHSGREARIVLLVHFEPLALADQLGTFLL